METKQRYGVRVGDDGRWHGKYASLRDARHHAIALSNGDGTSLCQGQVVDFESHRRETWRLGRIHGSHLPLV